LSDYTSATIDLSDSRIYRDLTKPIGALNADRLARLIERYNELESFGFTEAEKFLYGSHYSSPGIVLHFLIRQEPFTTMAIELQSGRFDCPDRLFFDIASSWEGCLSSSSDMKELIPEFFCLPEMFLNTNNFPLGKTQKGRSVENVGLPPWAKGSPHEFVRFHREALESEYVSQHLHNWIDLIFGYKQRGKEAEAAHNIFHHLSYEGSVDLDKIADQLDRQAAESHIQNFGQTPSQLLIVDAHPCRLSAGQCWKPLIYDMSVPKRLRCHTPSKQFANKRTEHANGSCLKIQVMSDTIVAMYADLSVGIYRWLPTRKSGRLQTTSLRPMACRELSTSRFAIKRGSTIPPDQIDKGSRATGNWSFALTIGGSAKEELYRKAVTPPNRLMVGTDTLASTETSGLLVCCGYWDDTVRIHSTDGLRLIAKETGNHRGPIRCLAMGKDGALMVTGGHDGTCCVWVVAHSDMAVALSDGYVQTALGASNDGEQILSCCHVLWGHVTPITCVDLDSDLDAVVSGSQSGKICVHTIKRGEFIRSFCAPPVQDSAQPGPVSKIALDTTGNLVAHMRDRGLHTFTINGICLCSTDAGEHLNDMTICSRGEILITGGDACRLLIRRTCDLSVTAMLDLSRHGPIRCIALTPDDLNPMEQFLFIGSDDGMITIVDEDPNA
jgi:WD40 repeat protein